MAALNEATLRQLLRERITEQFDVVEIAEFEDETDSQGQPISHRDSYRRRYEGRLARLLEVVPERTDLHDEHIAVIRVLDATAPTERLFSWVTRSSTREYSGVSTPRYIVSFYSYTRPPRSRQT